MTTPEEVVEGRRVDIRRSLDDLADRWADMDRAHAEWEHDLAATIEAARDLGIHGAEIAERTGMSRAWLYRRFRAAMLG